jgi:hypothetical protein
MHPRDRLHKALQKIVHARASIVRAAAAWQAEGIETVPLSEPLVEIQEALAQLEMLSASLPAGGSAPLADMTQLPTDPAAGT